MNQLSIEIPPHLCHLSPVSVHILLLSQLNTRFLFIDFDISRLSKLLLLSILIRTATIVTLRGTRTALLGGRVCGWPATIVSCANRESSQAPGQTVFIALLQPGQAGKLNILSLISIQRWDLVLKVALFLSSVDLDFSPQMLYFVLSVARGYFWTYQTFHLTHEMVLLHWRTENSSPGKLYWQCMQK